MIQEKIKHAKDRYDKPTPKKWRRIGDSILVVGSAISGISAYIGVPAVAVAGIAITALGKIITNFAHE